ncbi:hypothetical protein [Rhizobium leguminosarum]|uniref:Uncharacterized protein n=1 Tax=Rhizobium leguminosarum TaxID=384 RepID=A0A7W9ZM35_RHILE|nr:hypothetical protein [Rhizobium leguminosarum]MBB6219196.1 hypothetical protein [Rhizobium leguminosarum]
MADRFLPLPRPIFAFLGEAETGFIVAMSAGGSVQLLGGVLAWRSL